MKPMLTENPKKEHTKSPCKEKRKEVAKALTEAFGGETLSQVGDKTNTSWHALTRHY